MARDVLLAIAVAVISSLLTLYVSGNATPFATAPTTTTTPVDIDQLAIQLAAHPALNAAVAPVQLQVVGKSVEEAWIQGMGADGQPRPGPADDIKPLAPASNAVCFLTDIEIQHISDASDQLACRVSVDEFTGFWEVHAIQGEGTDASIRCNASCVAWQ